MSDKNFYISAEDVCHLSYHPDAFCLLAYLHYTHKDVEEEFTIHVSYYSKKWNWQNYRIQRGINTLLRHRYIKRSFVGGGDRGSHRYNWISLEDRYGQQK